MAMVEVAGSALSEAVRAKLLAAAGPLKLADVAKGLPKPKKTKAAEFQHEVKGILDEQLHLGLAFCYPSGKNGENRYWATDERNLVRTRVVDAADTPQTIAALGKEAGKAVKGTDKAYLESLIRELIGDDRLFEYAPKTKTAGPRFGTTPPPAPLPPLAQPKHQKAVDKLVKEARKLLMVSEAAVDDLIRLLHERLIEGRPSESAAGIAPRAFSASIPGPPHTGEIDSATAVFPPASSAKELEELLLKAVANAPVLSLKDVRDTMPVEFRGVAFDDAVVRLATEGRVVVFQDADPSRFSAAERGAYVQHGAQLYTTIAKRD